MHQLSLSCQVGFLSPFLLSNIHVHPLYLVFAYSSSSPGEIEKPCVVSLVDDSIHEDDEEFRLVLGTPKSKSPYGASVGEQKEVLVTIGDEKDSTCFVITYFKQPNCKVWFSY